MTGPARLGSHSLPFVIDKLRTFADSYGRGGKPARYVVYGNVLVHEDRVHADPTLVMRVLSHHRRMTKVELPFTARMIFATTNLRVVGLRGNDGLTAKVRLRGEKGLLWREMAARRLLAAKLKRNEFVSVPEVRAYDRRDGLWLVEEFVEATHSNAADMAAFLSTGGIDLYRATARLRPVLRVRQSYERLAADLRRLTPSAPAVADRSTWHVALCHGDFTKQNILRTSDGRFWLIDLEMAGVRPVAFDLAQACGEEPALVGHALAILESLGVGGDTLSATAQLALGLAAELQERIRIRAGSIDDQVRLFGKSRQQAEAIVDGAFSRIVDLIRSLAATG